MKLYPESVWKLECGAYSVETRLPTTNCSALLKSGLIPDPYKGLNEKETLWIGEKDTVLETSFEVAEELLTKPAELVMTGVDTVFEAFLNGTSVGGGANAFIRHRFDVTGKLTAGKNVLKVIVAAPKTYADAECKRINSKSLPGIAPITFLRKPQCHFGWDWGLDLPVSGILGEVYINFGSLKIEEFSATSDIVGERGEITVSAALYGDYEEYVVKVVSPSGKTWEKRGLPDARLVRTFEIEEPEIWWTADVSGKKRQPLYTVELSLVSAEETVSATLRTGIRTIKLDRSRLDDGTDFKFILNGKGMFMKGANWIPADAMPDRITREKLEYHIDAAVRAGFNMLRVWGGGYYESEEFYSLCDEKGILVWQDFTFACKPYPFYDEAFTANALSEVGYNVTRIKSHPSLALWCGNNEIEALVSSFMIYPKYVEAQKKFFYETLPALLRRYDEITPYIPGTPIGAEYLKGVQADNVGDTHLWAVWHGLQDITYYRTRKTRFCSEFGFESFPDMRTIKYYASDTDLGLYTPVMKAHQKCALGNEKTVYYTASLFRLPEKFEDAVYLSQLAQAESIRDATEAWRRSERTWGALYWQFNDCWPVASWSSVDSFGRYKALQYAARRFNAPFAVSAEENEHGISVYVLNDLLCPRKGNVVFKICDFCGNILIEKTYPVDIESGGILKLGETEYDFGKRRQKELFYSVSLTDENGDEVSACSKPLTRDRHCRFPVPKYSLNVSERDGKTVIAVTSDVYSRLTEVYTSSDTPPFEDNFTDILPGQTKEFVLPGTLYDPRSFKIRSVNTVRTKGTALGALIRRAAIFLNPVNFFSWLYYRTASFEYKE